MDSNRESYQDLLRRCSKKKKTETTSCVSKLLPVLRKGDVIELFGGHVTGATSLLCSAALDCLVTHPSARVLYVDCDRGVSPHKFLDLLVASHPDSDPDSVLPRLLVSQCCTVHELESVLESVENNFKQSSDYADIVIIDNVLSFYWSCLHNKHTLRDRILPRLLAIKPFCTLLLSWHPPVKQTDNILPPSWSKLVTRKLILSGQANPRSLVEEGGGDNAHFGGENVHFGEDNAHFGGDNAHFGGDNAHSVRFNVDLRTGVVTRLE